MTPFLRGMTRAVISSFDLPGPVLEVGSLQVDGDESIDLRPFVAKEYIGLDMRPGKGVDVVGSVEALPLADASVGSVLALSTFEHVERFWKGFDEVYRVLKPDGVFLVSCPFNFHIHDYPHDFWRFTPDALRSLLRPYKQVLVGSQGPEGRPSNVFALAVREKHPGLTPEAVGRFKAAMAAAADPMPAAKTLRYRLAALLGGKGAFAPYLQRNRWRVELHAGEGRAA